DCFMFSCFPPTTHHRAARLRREGSQVHHHTLATRSHTCGYHRRSCPHTPGSAPSLHHTQDRGQCVCVCVCLCVCVYHLMSVYIVVQGGFKVLGSVKHLETIV